MVDEEIADDFAIMGAPYEQDEISKKEAFEVLAVNHRSFEVFLECRTQWRTASTMAGITFIGLDYAACKLVLDDLQSPPYAFSDLRAMEHEALKHLNHREAR